MTQTHTFDLKQPEKQQYQSYKHIQNCVKENKTEIHSRSY